MTRPLTQLTSRADGAFERLRRHDAYRRNRQSYDRALCAAGTESTRRELATLLTIQR